VAQRQFFEELQLGLTALPGVDAATVSSGLPGAQQGFSGDRFALDGVSYAREQDLPTVRTLSVAQGFLETLEIQLKQGRTLSPGDREGALPVGLVTERFARQFLDGGNPIGRRVRLGGLKSEAPWITIVGVVSDVFGGDPTDPKPAAIFRPLAQAHSAFAYVAVRTPLPPLEMTQPVRDAVASLQPDMPIYWAMSYAAAIAEPLWAVRVFGTMFMIFGFVALFLASIGLYAVMSFSVSRRSREMGVRMALGSSARGVIGLVLRQGAWQLGIGLAAGLAFAAVISRAMTVILFDVKPLDATVFSGVALALVIAGLVACLVPARRATGVDPAVVMRSE
jgi:predicted permease